MQNIFYDLVHQNGYLASRSSGLVEKMLTYNGESLEVFSELVIISGVPYVLVGLNQDGVKKAGLCRLDGSKTVLPLYDLECGYEEAQVLLLEFKSHPYA